MICWDLWKGDCNHLIEVTAQYRQVLLVREMILALWYCKWRLTTVEGQTTILYMTVGSLYIGLMVHCVVPKGIHTSPTEGIFLRPPTPVEIPVKLHTFTEIFGPLRPPPPPPSRNFQSLLLGGVWIFCGATHCSLVIVRITFLFLHRLPYCCLCKAMHRKGTLLELCKCCNPYSALYQKVIIKILRLLGLHIAKVLK